MVGHLHQSGASGVQLSNQMPPYPRLKGQVDSRPFLVYSYPPLPGVGEGHLCGVQLVVLISRWQGVEHDLAHQLVGTRQTRESLYRCPQGPSPRNKTQWGLGEGGRKGGKLSHTPPPTCSPPPHTPGGSHQTKGNPHHFTRERKNFHREEKKNLTIRMCWSVSQTAEAGKDKLGDGFWGKSRAKSTFSAELAKSIRKTVGRGGRRWNVRSPSWFHRTDSQGCVNGCYCTSPWKGSNMQDPLWMSTNPVSN